MSEALTIVMYHYVRDFDRTRYPEIKGLDVNAFERQLDHLQENFTIVRMEDVIGAVRGDLALPTDPALLTFDDGYADHYDVAFPILHRRGLQGSFFPPVHPIRDRVMLDVNRVHFILASGEKVAALGAAIDRAVETSSDDFELDSVANYRAVWAQPNRFDDAETIYVKRMLQTALPEELRGRIARALFAEFVGVDEQAFASELYLTPDQARLMIRNGMYFGSHGASHYWLNQVDAPTQERDVDESISFLSELGMPTDDHWAMCYPYGGWDEKLLDLLRRRGCTIGLTTEVRAASLGTDDPLLLPRLDTNDLPR